MRKINKSKPPGSFETYIKTIVPTPRYENIPQNVSIDLRLSLLNEQGWVCGYCQQKISTPNQTKIEHHCEQSICNGENGNMDRTLDYTNLMAVCSGKAGYGILHCDSSKATFNSSNGLPINVSPWNNSHMQAIFYTSNGLVKSSIITHNNEIIKILNLNTKHLKELRKKKFILFFAAVGNIETKRGKEKLKKLLEEDLEFSNNKFSNDFPGLSKYMLKYCQ